MNELFMGVLAHDLRTPLAAIVTAGQLIRAREAGGDGRNAKALGRNKVALYRRSDLQALPCAAE